MSITATSGVVSNIDYQSLITQLVNVRKYSINQLESEKSALKSAQTAYSNLSTKIKSLITAADALKSGSAFSIFKTTTSESSYFTATAGSTSAAGSYEVTVNSLAKAHRIAADGVATDTTVIASAAGSFSFQVGSGDVQTVSVDSTTTLAGLRDSINALDAGVSATVVNEGTGANPYRLVLTSDTTGTGGAVTITQNDTTLAFSTTLQAAQNASVTVDGITFTRSTNSVSDIITGVSLDLTVADPLKTITLTVSRDSEEIGKKVKAIVDAYNGVASYVKANNRYDSETKKGGPFFGDGVARSVWEDLRRIMTSAVSGLPDSMNRLQHVGVKTGDDGLMAFDSSAFSTALSGSYDDVVKMFVKGESISGFGDLLYEAASDIDDFVDGRIKGRQNGIDKNIKRLDDDIREKDAQLFIYEEQLRSQFTTLETMLASLQSQSNALVNYFGG
ncbi:MAG TPA: hypothetical protein DDW94_04170 [Deltaproteobacteria bacterium]|nr:MAG: hypothetical protein A2Z79_10610 [Deltaproteobacteria bacterium GWA2_55_82]OGQ62923.1 MAG: hypothetical protein A3I81_06360 [Deltaproteobacteria bacterium RIFCSPLOWO2_02_FULL_55_12]OIJ72885.1 MAG: hypothetical protein A2V21_300595 [Deltaproteobacteria bacterium GWC2_55_46]HBG46168.1 hypothetical protein [Deltaproteobacteria bacterium]HCY11666.1 hypothetical protein [Deltaproteobacteria bacterium]